MTKAPQISAREYERALQILSGDLILAQLFAHEIMHAIKFEINISKVINGRCNAHGW